MPVISVAITVFTTVGFSLATATFLANMVVSYGIAFIAQKLGEDGRENTASEFNAGIKSNPIDPVAPIPIVYGERVVGGPVVFRGVSGADNKYLHQVMVLSEGECDSVSAVYLNDKSVADVPSYIPLVSYIFHNGAVGAAADSDLIQASGDWTDDHRGWGTCYLYLRLEYDPSVFDSGLPNVTVKLKGLEVFDPRDSSTAWSENPALCLRDYLTHPRYGRGIDSSAIDDESFIDAANYCDAIVTVKDSDGAEFTQARYTCNGVLNPDETSLENIRKLLTSCRGMLVFVGGKYKLVIDKPETPAFAFTEDNIVGAWNITGGGKRDVLNRVVARFFDPDMNWQEALSVVDSPVHRAQDNGLVLEADIELAFTAQIQRANILAQHHLKQSRQGWRASFSATIEALQVQVGDVVTITHQVPGWSAKPFRVHGLALKDDDTVEVQVGEYDDSVYTFDLLTPPAVPDTDLPDPFSTPPPKNLTVESGTQHLVVSASGTVITRIFTEWETTGAGFVSGYEIGYKLSVNSGWTDYTTAVRQHYFAPVSDGSDYDLRVRAIYASGKKSDWIYKWNYTVVGKTEPPAAPASFTFATQRDYTRLFSWTPNHTDPDVAGYQIRYSATLSHTWDDMTPMHLGLLVSSPWETTILNAGDYRFAIKTLDTTGNESAMALYITAELLDPPVVSVFFSEYPHLLGWPGTLTDCYKTAGNVVVATDTKNWDDLATDGVTWATWTGWARAANVLVYEHTAIDLGSIEIFRPVIRAEATGTVGYEINHSQDNSTWSGWITPSNDITARYLKVRITVTGTSARLYSASILYDGQQYTDDIVDLATSSLSGDANRYIAAGNIRIPTTTPFNTITSIHVTLQNTGHGWTWELIDKATTYGPQIKIYDNTGTLADATIDATIKGY